MFPADYESKVDGQAWQEKTRQNRLIPQLLDHFSVKLIRIYVTGNPTHPDYIIYQSPSSGGCGERINSKTRDRSDFWNLERNASS